MGTCRYVFYFSVFLLILFSNLYPSEAVNQDFRYFDLENQLKVVIVKKDSLPLVNIVLAVDVGTKCESADNSGILHLLEHLLLFRGRNFSKEIRAHGGYFNGHTDRDLAMFEISLPAANLEFGLSILKEMIFEFDVASDGLEKEKKVIEREIQQIEDDPFRWGRSRALQNLFVGHAYSLPVFGNIEFIKTSSAGDIMSFYKKHFLPGNCALAIVGNVEIPEAEKIINNEFSSLASRDIEKRILSSPAELKKTTEIQHFMDTKKVHLIMAFLAPRYKHPDYLPMHVLTEILGEGVNPLLSGLLKGGRQRLAEKISMQYIPMMQAGAVVVHLVLEKKNINAARLKLLKFFKEVPQFRFTPEDYPPGERMFVFDFLTTAKNQMQVGTEEYLERGLNHAASFARYFLLNRNLTKESHREDRLEKVESGQLRQAAAEYLSGKKHVLITILPKEES